VPVKTDKRSKWDDRFYLVAYRMRQEGASKTQVAEALGVSLTVFKLWARERPALAEALKAPLKTTNPLSSLDEFIAGRLSPGLRPVWRRIVDLNKNRSPVGMIRQVMEDAGVKARQRLFLHALILKRFDASAALSCCGLSKQKDLDVWLRTDPDFAALVEEVSWHEDQFFASKLRELVNEGNPAATIYAAKRRLTAMGFGEAPPAPLAVHQHQHVHNTFDVDCLPADLKRQVLEAYRQWQQKNENVKELPAHETEVRGAD
jgi:hypothetical protein